MCEHFSYSVSTGLALDRVWNLFEDIENWPKFSDVYDTLKWSGSPWTPGSVLVGSVHYPRPMIIRCVVETCEPASSVTYVAHSTAAGFATHRTIRFAELHGRTWIQVDSYMVGQPRFAVAEGGHGFLRVLTERWFEGFVRFCDKHATAGAQVLPFIVCPKITGNGEDCGADETLEKMKGIAQ
jgi:hypothetical protein